MEINKRKIEMGFEKKQQKNTKRQNKEEGQERN
jgi:hypothetical protein